ncbi:hypothetical protein D0Z00_003928 [Geotrichum galactomycetum]|uniref:Uncharacterized protein n=1 Tax=Geotrichum galactomycetum TaxID=27317 RepID=A0ACB6V064_9ASCO|nr:hypothetical protein D0Z00_003928 [Geotrichum candidum]
MPKVVDKTKQRHNPLHVSLTEAEGRLKSNYKKSKRTTGEDQDDEYVDAQTSRKILQMARDQQDEIDAEERVANISQRKAASSKLDSSRYGIDGLDEDETVGPAYNSDEEDDEEGSDYEEYEQIEEYEINPEDEALFGRYVDNREYDDDEEEAPVTLADKIMAKIRAKEQENEEGPSRSVPSGEEREGVSLPPKVIMVYEKVGELLSRYRSGKLPRAFKIIPTLRNWEDVLYVTQPESWSTQAVYEATKLFISTLSAQQSQKFVFNVLLDRFKTELDPTAPRAPGSGPKTLNYHLYRALKKSLYKPAAFFKGFLFPLAESGSCSLREAVIAASILTKVSVPALHSAAALMRLSEFEYYSGPISLFIKVLLDKKYALPYKVVDSVVFHFMRFRAPKTTNKAEQNLPVMWHQALLVFAQRYKNDITEDQRDGLLEVIKIQSHPAITPEIRRELMSGAPRVEDENAMEF